MTTTTTTTMTTTITSLPDLCLLTIFDHVPLKDILTKVSLTCRRWHSLRHSIIVRRTGLSLAIQNEGQSTHQILNHIESSLNINSPPISPIADFCWPTLSVIRVNQGLCPRLSGARIHHLVVTNHISQASHRGRYHEDVDQLMTLFSLSQLLTLWGAGLTTLRLNGSWFGGHRSEWCAKLVGIISSKSTLPALLVLELDFWLLKPMLKRQSSFPLLSQLSRFETSLPTTSTSEYLVWFCRWISGNYQGNNRLEIRFSSPYLDSIDSCSNNRPYPQPNLDEMEQIYSSRAPLGQFTGFFPYLSTEVSSEQENFYPILDRFCAHFTRLTTLQLVIHSWSGRQSLSRLSGVLAQMRELSALELVLFLRSPNSRVIEECSVHQDIYHSLASVRRLSLRFCEYSPSTIDQWATEPWAEVVPSLEVLRISDFYLRDNPFPRPFLACARLRQIVVHQFSEDETHIWTAEQFLRQQEMDANGFLNDI